VIAVAHGEYDRAMPTVARTVEEETRRAWGLYAARLEGLEGEEYDRAEQEAWAALQDTLDELQGGSSLGHPAVG
jgi:hypothetical protein